MYSYIILNLNFVALALDLYRLKIKRRRFLNDTFNCKKENDFFRLFEKSLFARMQLHRFRLPG